MTKQGFLGKLKNKRVLELVDGSDEITESYLIKAGNSLKAAKILKNNKLYENAISSAYYSMYNALTALLFKVGIKCQDHNGSILLLKKVFNKEELFKAISTAKDERIDKQYYVPDESTINQTTKGLISRAEEFITEIKLIIKKITNKEITETRNKIKQL